MTVELAVEVGGLRLRGPVLAASGTFGYGTEVRAREGQAPPAKPTPVYRTNRRGPIGGGGPAEPGHAGRRI